MNSRLTNNTSSSGSGLRLGVILLPIAIIGGIGAMIWFVFIGPQMRHDRLEREGIRMTGTLVNAEETGTVINDHPELDLTVAIRRPNGSVDTAITSYVPGFTEYALFQKGAQLTIAVDSSDPKDFTVLAIGDPVRNDGGISPGSPGMSDSLQQVIQRLQDSLRSAIPQKK